MQLKTIWQFGSSDPENANHLAAIQQWWASLNGQEILWQQRLVTPSEAAADLNWELQRFDEKFIVTKPEIRGITLYWFKFNDPQERNATADKLEFDALKQQLYIYPQSQKEVVIRIEIPKLVFQTLTLSNPDWSYQHIGDSRTLTMRDAAQALEVNVQLSAENLKQLLQQLTQSK
jgi:hypothetical protein